MQRRAVERHVLFLAVVARDATFDSSSSCGNRARDFGEWSSDASIATAPSIPRKAYESQGPSFRTHEVIPRRDSHNQGGKYRGNPSGGLANGGLNRNIGTRTPLRKPPPVKTTLQFLPDLWFFEFTLNIRVLAPVCHGQYQLLGSLVFVGVVGREFPESLSSWSYHKLSC